MRVLTFTSLYPNSVQPRHGIFVEQRVRQLSATGEATIDVVAPVPYVPVSAPIFGRFRALADVPSSDDRHGIPVVYPRFLAVPKVTGWINPVSMALGALPAVNALRRRHGEFDVIDAHFLYPDGAAAALLGSWLRTPTIVTARGTDANVFPRYTVPRLWIEWVARRAAALVTVSAALRTALIELNVPTERVVVLRNGVDLGLFSPGDREATRRRLGIEGQTLLSVGHLIGGKGHGIVLEMLAKLPQVRLIVIGEGPLAAQLRASANLLGVASRVRWISNLPQSELAGFYAAADVTILASAAEGMPNVVLESLACGTPVIATAVGGVPEIVSSPDAGALVRERTSEALCEAYRRLLAAPPRREAVRRHAEQFGWEPTIRDLLGLLRSIRPHGRPVGELP